MGTITRPVRFAGTREQAAANKRTHLWFTEWYDEDDCETRCGNCDCKPWHVTAEYPCGAAIPRETTEWGAA